MHKSAFLSALLAAALLLDAIGARSVRGEIVYSGSNLSENFDSLGTTSVPTVWSSTIGVQAAVPGATGFDGAKLAGSGISAALIASDGTLGTGGIYSFGASAGGTQSNRALGALASSGNTMAFGFALLNNAPGTVITALTISFNQENWRTPTVANNRHCTPSVLLS